MDGSNLIFWRSMLFKTQAVVLLKVATCEILDRLDFHDFYYTIKSLGERLRG